MEGESVGKEGEKENYSRVRRRKEKVPKHGSAKWTYGTTHGLVVE